MKKKSNIITLCSTRNKNVLDFQVEMIDSFVENTPDECKILFIENTSEEKNHKIWKDYVLSKGQNFIFSKSGYNINKLYNEGTQLTSNEYIMYSNSDIVFHPNWYYSLLKWFEEIDNLFVISPFTKAFDWAENPQGVYRRDVTIEDRFFDTIHMPGWFYCFQRKTGFVWDEKFKAHYQDNDFVLTVEDIRKNNPELKSGIAYNSRVDHMGGMTAKNVEQDYFNAEGRKAMMEKWNRY